jgi:hypothetical protein
MHRVYRAQMNVTRVIALPKEQNKKKSQMNVTRALELLTALGEHSNEENHEVRPQLLE